MTWTGADAISPPDPWAIACPRCGATLAGDQDWCLNCGAPARTVIAPTPHWRRPILLLLTIAALGLGGLVAAFIALTNDDPPPSLTITRTTTLEPGAAPPPGVKTVTGPTTTAAPGTP
ncbi:unannotated protein [freshwater metagenome]|uniref:Unannotated protein n=1 Tax=freshwater metagenome TaxID=449393 RepID=A0A6J7E3F2_9ZZZZ|nr:hypothetical protein [Actinomycetota bacterium]